MALLDPLDLLKAALGWSKYRDANPVHSSPLADDLATAPSGPVLNPDSLVNLSCLQ